MAKNATTPEDLHDGMPAQLSMDTICKGAVIELGNEALLRIAENMADVNTDPQKKRIATIHIEVSPYTDRRGANVSVKVDTKLAGLKPADGTMYIAKKGGQWLPYGTDTRQTEMDYGMNLPDGKGPSTLGLPDGKTASTKPQ